MNSRPTRCVAVAAILCACMLPVVVTAADTLRCGSKIITLGMSADEVLRHCGEPAKREVEQQDVRSGNRVTGTTEVHIWTYRRAGAEKVLRFDQDRLIAIR